MDKGSGHEGSRSGDGARREPRISVPTRSPDDVAISSDDRLLPGDRPRRIANERREPGFDAAPSLADVVGPVTRRGNGRKQKSAAATSAPRRRRRSLVSRLGYWAVVLGLWCVAGVGGLVVYEARDLPPIDQLSIPKRPPNIAIMGSTGTLLANRGDTGGAAVLLRDLPPYVPQAFIAIEDRRFYSHWGIDPVGILRAIVRNASGGAVQGGSTLTQQLAKNLFLNQERTLSRKVQEAILALWLEHRYSKTQILELYLNRVYFGSGAYGVEAAAHRYYGKNAKDLTLPEAAVLAGLMKAPTKLAPNRNPQGATERAAQVIDAMADEGFITRDAARQALVKPAVVAHEKGDGSVNYVADYVMDTLDDTVGAFDTDIVVTTTVDPAMQAAGERALADALDAKGAKFGVSQGALVALDPSGAIKVLIGGRNYAESQFDRAVAAKRQPGSAFKPFVYLTALERGLTPDSVRDDAPVNVKGWQPENYSRQYAGPVTLTTGLAQSLNTVAVRLGVEVGPKAVIATAHRLGITSDLQPNASIALGTSEVSPLELVTAYVPFSNGGMGVQPHIIMSVKRTSGQLLYQRKGTGYGRVIDKTSVAMMNAMMRETLLTGTARKADLPGWQAAGKTGTSQDWRDAWFVGYTSALTAGIWLGNDDSSPTKKSSGGTLPVEIWSRFMTAALRTTAPSPLIGGLWRPAPAAEASTDPLLGAVASMLNGGASAPKPAQAGALLPIVPAASPPPAPPQATRRPDPDVLLPPEPIPDPRGTAKADNRSLLDKLFGGG
ncbi:transglycosylase domain-containing protein [Lichenifustis flavocetrariae]|uniref:PBP1A family penicillin-binding protein n=1 Tax=Lichenifustis flavocetrariae TaxID=2949735 RepID=A0AA41YTI7_9HYPH|nr:PBP1A family penicillin-binding protein [Lichenifustis flavocetrariae]MCW6506553.1 PBP1A family penicillin-binding protein [Lichenifustis flavocetrariae]